MGPHGREQLDFDVFDSGVATALEQIKEQRKCVGPADGKENVSLFVDGIMVGQEDSPRTNCSKGPGVPGETVGEGLVNDGGLGVAVRHIGATRSLPGEATGGR